MTDVLLFGAFPYVAVVLLVVISVLRYRWNAFTISSLSSQFLESRRLFWGSVPFHLGILSLFFGHLLGFLLPTHIIAWNSVPLRLLILELTGLVSALLFGVGLVLLILRRATEPRLKVVTTWVDLLVYAVLLFQVVTGLWISLGLRWGSSWYTQIAVPYLRSLVVFQPELKWVQGLPWIVKLHILGAFSLFTVFSFTRLMHVLVAPIPYLWRRTQLVLWNRDRRAIRDANARG
jgi:nitrate reductase gamma subunit